MYSFEAARSGVSRTVPTAMRNLFYIKHLENSSLNHNIRVTKEKFDILGVNTQRRE